MQFFTDQYAPISANVISAGQERRLWVHEMPRSLVSFPSSDHCPTLHFSPELLPLVKFGSQRDTMSSYHAPTPRCSKLSTIYWDLGCRVPDALSNLNSINLLDCLRILLYIALRLFLLAHRLLDVFLSIAHHRLCALLALPSCQVHNPRESAVLIVGGDDG